MTLDIPFKGSISPSTKLNIFLNFPPIDQPYSSELKQLASKMLKMDSDQRITASDILKMPFIHKIHPQIPSHNESSSSILEMTTPEELFKLVKQKLDEKKFGEVQDFLTLAIKGDLAETMKEYSKISYEEQFNHQRIVELEQYLQIAIQKDDVGALNHYAIFLSIGVFGKEKIPLSEEFYLKAIMKGNISALISYASTLSNGVYGKEKIPLSEEYYLKAIAKGDVSALCNYAAAIPMEFMEKKKFHFLKNITSNPSRKIMFLP
jgi:hypothetical protein